jgi:hypothetical protein
VVENLTLGAGPTADQTARIDPKQTNSAFRFKVRFAQTADIPRRQSERVIFDSSVPLDMECAILAFTDMASALSDAPDPHRPGSSFDELLEPRFGGLDDLLVQIGNERIDRAVFDRLEDPFVVLDPKIL